MYPILFSIGKINFYTYGLFAAISVIAVYFVIDKLSKFKRLSRKDLFNKILTAFIFGLIGSRIAYFIIYHYQFSHWYEVFFIWNGGLISFGGIIGALCACVVIFRRNLYNWLDILAVSFLLGSSIWRIGGYLSGGNPGIVSNWVIIINNQIPAVLIESIIMLIAFFVIYRIYKRSDMKSGLISWIVFGFYGIVRVAVDYFRDYEFNIGVLKTGQFVGALMFVISLFAIFYMIIYDKYRRFIKGKHK